jgi:hypothetical protein
MMKVNNISRMEVCIGFILWSPVVEIAAQLPINKMFSHYIPDRYDYSVKSVSWVIWLHAIAWHSSSECRVVHCRKGMAELTRGNASEMKRFTLSKASLLCLLIFAGRLNSTYWACNLLPSRLCTYNFQWIVAPRENLHPIATMTPPQYSWVLPATHGKSWHKHQRKS